MAVILPKKHLKSKHLTFWTLFCPVFKWSVQMIRQNIWKPDILDHITYIFVLFSGHHHLKTGISTPRPFDNQTCLDHLNTRLVCYSDGYCTECLNTVSIRIPDYLVSKIKWSNQSNTWPKFRCYEHSFLTPFCTKCLNSSTVLDVIQI